MFLVVLARCLSLVVAHVVQQSGPLPIRRIQAIDHGDGLLRGSGRLGARTGTGVLRGTVEDSSEQIVV